MQGSKRNDPAYDAESAYAKAAKAELAKDYDSAFGLYLQSAQAYLHLGRSIQNQEKEKLRWKARAEKALERAEKIKAFAEKSKNTFLTGLSRGSTPGPSRSTREAVVLTPVGINPFSVQEQLFVLKKGNKVNGLHFPLWSDPAPPLPTSSFRDPDGQPTLSPEQMKFSPIWRRPQSGQETTSITPTFPPSEPKTPPEILPENIIQNIVTDCSVCASISVCLEHARRFGTNLAKGSVCNEESQSSAASGFPFNRNRYDIKLLFNGAWRRVMIDDMLPYHPEDGNLLCMSAFPSNSAKVGGPKASVLWPSLLEKGVSILTSSHEKIVLYRNSSIDLHALAGWIPEHIEIKSALFERERTWDRIVGGFYSGKGDSHFLQMPANHYQREMHFYTWTGPREGIFWQDTELLPSHSYAVIDVFDGEKRGVTVLDSWANPRAEDQPTRMLQIPWPDVLDTFDSIYLSWDPRIWPKTLTVHQYAESSQQLQVEFTNLGGLGEEVWLLLTRHVSETRRISDFISLRAEVGDNIPAGGLNSYSTIDINGTYTNSTHALARVTIPPSQPSGFLSVLASYDGEAKEVGFTLTVYASPRMNIAWDERIHTPPFTVKVDGALITKNAGGNWSYPTYMLNPQYLLRIDPVKIANNKRGSKAKITLTLQTKKEIPVNILVVWSQGVRISELAASSGAYSYGLARVRTELAPGTYAVIPSAFEPHHLGPFSLRIDSSNPAELTLIPHEGAGMYTKILRGAWHVFI
ncbi:hypothetical protein BD779DRAFT_1513523 [Infundibulicybe gibba]|nr:hypothetical protein BD779DRAFT_1513523 [Infundibulicybe gibba]